MTLYNIMYNFDINKPMSEISYYFMLCLMSSHNESYHNYDNWTQTTPKHDILPGLENHDFLNNIILLN